MLKRDTTQAQWSQAQIPVGTNAYSPSHICMVLIYSQNPKTCMFWLTEDSKTVWPVLTCPGYIVIVSIHPLIYCKWELLTATSSKA